MFDSPYPIKEVGQTKAIDKRYFIKQYIYHFRSKNSTWYLIEVEQYSGDIFILKFYLKKDKKNKFKFNLLSNEHSCSRIIATCMDVLFLIYKNKPKASFGFIGSQIYNPVLKVMDEEKINTKRFKVYKSALENKIGKQKFTHFIDETNSTYLLVSNGNTNVESVNNKAKKMFEEEYPELIN